MKTPNQRWQEGIDHHPESERIVRRIAQLDCAINGDSLGLSIGGDGDNGEALMYLLDMVFEEDTESRAASVGKEEKVLQDE